MGSARGNYGDWKRGRYGASEPDIKDPSRQPIRGRAKIIYQIISPSGAVVSTVSFEDRAAAERLAAVLSSEAASQYVVRSVKVAADEPVRYVDSEPVSPPTGSESLAEDKLKRYVFRPMQDCGNGYSASFDRLKPTLNFQVMDEANNEVRLEIEMSAKQMLELVDYIVMIVAIKSAKP